MKKIALSLATLLTLSSVVFAEDVTSQVEKDNGFYVGVGYGYLNQTVDNISTVSNIDIDVDNILLQAGYDINKYVALEFRLWESIGDASQSGGDKPGNYSQDSYAWGAYIKPMYPILKNLNVYAMLGYSNTSLQYNNGEWSTDAFSWGAGVDYTITQHISVFVDYLNLGMKDDTSISYTPTGFTTSTNADINIYTVNVGVTYKF